MRRILIQGGETQVLAELNATPTADAIWEALPFTGEANTWGDEIYFSIPVRLQEQDAQAVVALGDLGYWPPGNAFCVFFGLTPVSKGKDIRPASPVNVFGRVIGDLKSLKQVRDGQAVSVERVEEL